MRNRQHDSAAERKYAICHDAERVVRNGCTNAEQDETCDRAKNDAHIAVPGEPGADRYDAQRYYDDQHLHVQVASGQRQQYWQRAHEEGQCQAMQEAQTRQSDGCAIEPVRRFRWCLIHPEMPLCWAGGKLMRAAGVSGRK